MEPGQPLLPGDRDDSAMGPIDDGNAAYRGPLFCERVSPVPRHTDLQMVCGGLDSTWTVKQWGLICHIPIVGAQCHIGRYGGGMTLLAFLDGTVTDADHPRIRATDLGLLRGDGVFETILVADGRPRELGPHLDRFIRSASLLDLPLPERPAWERLAELVIKNWPDSSEIALKLVYTRGIDGDTTREPTGFALGTRVEEHIVRARTEGLSVVTLERGIDPGLAERAPWLLLGAKSLSYAVNMAAAREAQRRGADDAIFTATDGSVLEGPTANVVAVHGGTLSTPPPVTGILPGTTQGGFFEAAEKAGWRTTTEPLSVPALREADGVFLTSSVRKLARVHTLDGQVLPDSTRLHAELSEVYESHYR